MADASVGIPMDPRIKARRTEVRRSEARRRLRVLLTVASSVTILASGWAVTRSALLDVDTVAIKGATRAPRVELLRAAGLHGRVQLTDVEPGHAAERLEKLAWVERATVERHWPGTIRISIVEARPVAAALVGAAWAEVDAKGSVLAIVSEQPALPVIEGVDEAALGEVLPDALGGVRVASLLTPALREVVSVVRIRGGQLELVLSPAGRVLLGPPEHLGEKLTALQTVIAATELSGDAVLDVRVPSAPVLTRGDQ
jgi:cell division protein FtsQ